MSRFPTADHLAAWAGMAPGNNESAGRNRSGKTRKGDRALSSALTQAAQAAAHTKDTYLATQFHRIAARRGKKRAIVAVAHLILVIAYYLIQKREPYQDLGNDYFDKQDAEATKQRLLVRLEKLGYQVALQSKQATASAQSIFRVVSN